MLSFELLAVITLVFLSLGDLGVGVANDAVNFINSAIGARAASRKVILIVASIGILMGATFSAGLLEVARKGIFHPNYFNITEALMIFAAVAMADIVLLDLFSSFGIPVSTTVSVVFELFGAALIMAFLKTKNFDQAWEVINAASAAKIVIGILLSIIIALALGLVAQFVTRLLFTFDYEPRLKKFGFIWCGAALSSLVFYLLLEGGKHASFMTPQLQEWFDKNTFIILAGSFLLFAPISLILIRKKINILKIIILIGTGALAMAFAGNDLVNFIGVSVGGVHAFLGADLSQKIATPTWVLLIAGIVMIIALFRSKKAKTVTYTEVNLASHEKSVMRQWKSNIFAEKLTKMIYYVYRTFLVIVPKSVQKAIASRFEHSKLTKNKEAAFDLLRGSVNLMVAAAIISYATSKKLPLSTTFVTFMVAMGTSLADGVWDLKCAPSRITGIMTVIFSWFFTALMAFLIGGMMVAVLYYFKTLGLIFLLIISGILLYHFTRMHKRYCETKINVPRAS